jgi:hypothetical protein
MQLRLLLAAILLWAGPAFAQYARADFSLTNAQGQAISGAQVYVLQQPNSCSQVSGSQYTCASFTPLQTLYGSATGSGTAQCGGSAGEILNPQTTDGFGHACAYIAPGAYMFCYYSTSTGTICFPDQSVYSSSGAYCSISGCTYSGNVSAPEFIGNLSGGYVGAFGYAPDGRVDCRNSAFGAVGDGATDDTAHLQACWNYALTNHRRMYLATPSVCYRVSSPLLFGNWGGTMEIDGDARGLPQDATASPICYTSGIGTANPVIDAVMHGDLVVNGISIVRASGNSTYAGTCILSTPDTVGGGNVHVYNTFCQAGNGAGGNAMAIIGQDLSNLTSSNLYSQGNGVILGNGGGPSTVVSHYTSGAGYGATHLVISGSIIQSTLSPFEGTGNCGDYVFDNSNGSTYFAELNGGDSTHAIIDFSYAVGCTDMGLSMHGVNIENQSSATPFATIATVNSTGAVSNGISITTGTWTGRVLGGAVTFAGIAYGVYANIIGGGTAFGDSTWWITGTFSNPELGALSPSAGGSPGYSGLLGGSLIIGGWANPETIAEQPTSPYSSEFKICSTNNGNGACWSNTGSASGSSINYLGKYNYASTAQITLPSAQVLTSATLLCISTGTNCPTPARGEVALVSGTATVSNAAACAVGSTCIYKLTNCGTNSSVGIGVPTIGTITAGTSFVINSVSAADAVVTTDASTICWQVN